MGQLKRLFFPALLGLAAYYAVFGGQYSVFEVHRARVAIGAESAELARLHHEIDSLESRTDSLEFDASTLERIARERFGMIREGEVLYRLVEPDEEQGTATPEEGR